MTDGTIEYMSSECADYMMESSFHHVGRELSSSDVHLSYRRRSCTYLQSPLLSSKFLSEYTFDSLNEYAGEEKTVGWCECEKGGISITKQNKKPAQAQLTKEDSLLVALLLVLRRLLILYRTLWVECLMLQVAAQIPIIQPLQIHQCSLMERIVFTGLDF